MTMIKRLPETLAALREGRIDFPKAKMIEEETQLIDDMACPGVEARVLPRAERQTLGQLRRAVQRAALEADPAGMANKREAYVKGRCLEVRPHPSGTADLSIQDAPAEQATAAETYVGALASGLKNAGDTRTMNQLCADIALALLMGIPQPRLAAPSELVGPRIDDHSGAQADRQSQSEVRTGRLATSDDQTVQRGQSEAWRLPVRHPFGESQ